MELKEVILNEAKNTYGLNALTLFSNGGLNGLIFNYGNDKLIKITSWNTRAFGPCKQSEIESKLKQVNNLKGKGLLVPQIYTNPYGFLSTVITFEDRPYIIYAMEKINTTPNDTDFNMNWGLSLGKIHSNSEENAFHDYQYEWNNINNLCEDEKLKKIWSALLMEISSFEKTERNYGLLHGDPQPNNFLPTENGMYAIDFDMMFNGFFAHDIAIGLQYKFADIKNYLQTELSLEEREKTFTDFMTGYYSGAKFDKSLLSQIDTFLRYRRAMRFIALYKLLQKDKNNFEAVREKVLRNERIL